MAMNNLNSGITYRKERKSLRYNKERQPWLVIFVHTMIEQSYAPVHHPGILASCVSMVSKIGMQSREEPEGKSGRESSYWIIIATRAGHCSVSDRCRTQWEKPAILITMEGAIGSAVDVVVQA
jgi:hypothetical protein